MMSNSSSPEEKLLRLIKGQKPKEAVASHAVKPAAPAVAAQPKGKVPLLERVRRGVSFFTVNRLIAIALVCSIIYLGVSLTGAFFGHKKNQARSPVQQKTPSEELAQATPSEDEEVNFEKKPVDFYTQATAGKHIFATEALPSQEAQVPQSALNSEAIKDLNVIGIIADINPQVIIEDKKSQKTVYVGKGQSIGEFVVEEIREGKVILNYKGQKFELNI